MPLTVDAQGAASDSQRCGPHKPHAPSHHVRGVAPVDRALPLEDNGACRQPEGESRVPPDFLPAPHAPSVVGRRMLLPGGVC